MEGDNKTYKIVGTIPGAEVPLSAGSMTRKEAEERAQDEQRAYRSVGIGVKVKVVPAGYDPEWK
jgi:hypothetical protein